MKLLFLIDSLGSGGAQRQMVTIAPLFKQKGINVEVLCYHQDRFFIEPLTNAGIKVHWIATANPVMRILRVCWFIRRESYNSVISFLDTPDFLNCIAAIGGHTWKVITSERSAKEETFATWRGKLIGWIKKHSDTIVCNSENAKQLWLKYYPHYANKLTVIYNTVSLPTVTSIYIPRKDGKMHIVVAASFQELKNPINVIKAISLLSDSQQSKLILDWYGAKCVSTTGTRIYDEATELIDKYNLSEVVHLNSPITTIADKMNEADAVALFSQYEGLPNTICEAMMLAKPVIMSRVSDYNILVDHTNGVLCNWDNVVTIKDALSTLLHLTDEQLIAARKSSQKKAELLFGREIIVDRWMEVIKQ